MDGWSKGYIPTWRRVWASARGQHLGSICETLFSHPQMKRNTQLVQSSAKEEIKKVNGVMEGKGMVALPQYHFVMLPVILITLKLFWHWGYQCILNSPFVWPNEHEHVQAFQENNHLFGSFGVEGLSNDMGTVHQKCVSAPSEAFQLRCHRLLELNNEREEEEKPKHGFYHLYS